MRRTSLRAVQDALVRRRYFTKYDHTKTPQQTLLIEKQNMKQYACLLKLGVP